MKKSIWIMSLLFAVSTAWATTITDDFNRADTSSSTDTSLIGADWAQSAGSPNRWRIHSNTVYSLDSVNPCVMYNTALQTKNGDGGSFTLSLDVAGLGLSVWSGVAFNYNNPSNFYTVRFKAGYDDYQLLGKRANGSWNVIATGHAVTNFTVGSFYKVTVSSDTAYTYDFSIKESGSGTVMASETGRLDDESLATGGYAGLYLGSTSVNELAQFDNFSLDAVVMNVTKFADDFNRPNLSTTNAALIGLNWHQEVDNEWLLNASNLLSHAGTQNSVLYNTTLETVSGNGTNFTLTTTMRAQSDNQWVGIAFNYQDNENYYAFRFKSANASWQLLRIVGGSVAAFEDGNATETLLGRVYYTLTVKSSTPYEFDFTIQRAGSPVVLNSTTHAVDTAANFSGGYAGAYVGTTSYAGKYDNFELTVSSPLTGGYVGWATTWGVDLGEETDDYDADGLSNIYEYGLGGDPTNALDRGTSPESGVANISGTNWFGYVHPQLSDPDSGLSYYLELNTDLVSGTWTNSGYIVTGTNVTGGSLDFVTNVTDTVAGEKFIRLIIE